MVKSLRICLILLCVVSFVSGCASMMARQKGFMNGTAVVVSPMPFQNYCGFCDNKISEPKEEPAPTLLPRPRPVIEKPAPVPEQVREKIVLRGINFDFDKSDIKPEFVPVLDEAVEILKASPDLNVIIEGHTCWIGTEKYNQGLSEHRAASVCKYLVEKGISQNRLETVGYGENMPIADNHTMEGRRMNRRVVFKILD